MKSPQIHVVTGAFGFSGKYITSRLIQKGIHVRTLTQKSPSISPFNGVVKAFPFYFDRPDRLAETLKGAEVLYNTYWVRFNHAYFTHSEAVDNTLKLFEAAKRAGIKRIVHVSITNPSEDSPFEYFKGKAILERELMKCGIDHAILRPAVIFGNEDILINNIAWILRRFPVFGVFGDGNYRIQPIYVDDLAKLAVEQGERTDNVIIDAIGPETFTYRGLVQAIGQAIGINRRLISISPELGHLAGLLISKIFHDVTITKEEISGLMSDLLYTESSPVGSTKLTEWMKENSKTLGAHYSSELKRRVNGRKLN
ncbi:MAG TPA: NAD-dependent epimerase/dehydratase family protein [Thermodesulfovibrionales bacterium]|nr:NAD-dependent epimerase/dehydratase family protein [Thermodesulfovibrionales bacterium]